MLRKRYHLGRRILSGTLAFLLVAISVTGALTPMTTYAVEDGSEQKISYKSEEKGDIQIGIEAENTSFGAGEEVNLKIFLQNNTDETVTEGVLEWEDGGMEHGRFLSMAPDEQEEEQQDAALATDSDSDEEEGKLKGITLAPGETYQTEFHGFISSDIEASKKRNLTISFKGLNDGGNTVRGEQKLTYNTGMMSVLPVEFPEGNLIESNEETTMYIHTSLNEMTDAYAEPDSILDILGRTKRDNDATSSNAERATGSNAENDKESGIDKDDISYTVTTYGVSLKGVKAELIEITDSGEVITGIQFRAASQTEPGTYFGVVTSSVKYGGRTYQSSQGFHFVVTGEGMMVLKGKVNGAEIEVKGPAESFPEGDMLSLKVSEVPAEKEEPLLTALEKKAEENDIAINKMKAVDIKVIADGVEQELRGDVTVTFSGLELDTVKTAEAVETEKDEADTAAVKAVSFVESAKAVAASVVEELGLVKEETENAETGNESDSELAVWHFNEETGTLEDMYGVVGESGEVVMNTTHFSIFVLVDLPTAGGFINVTVEHWGTITTLDGEADPRRFVAGMVKDSEGNWVEKQVSYDTAFDREKSVVKTKQITTQIYTTDSIALQNQAYENIEDLSKVALSAANKKIPNYKVEKIWVTTDTSNIGKETWNAGTYSEYKNGSGSKTIKLAADSIIRVWYKEQDSGNYENDVTFYDHNVTDGRVYNTIEGNPYSGGSYYLGKDWQVRTGAYGDYKYLYSHRMGTNYTDNSNMFEGSGAMMGSGQSASGNKSSWVGSQWNGKFLNQGNDPLGQGIVTGIVTGLNSDGTLKFANGIRHAKFFEETYGKNSGYYATKKLTDNYKLKFRQVGDSYVLSNVTKGGKDQTGNLAVIRNYGNGKVYSNEFWPVDNCATYLGQDPLLGKPDNGFKFNRTTSDKTEESPVSQSDFGGAHNWHFGMKYEFTFKIGEYTGPMNYYFRGDDDFWLFIDGEKVIDIGGVHIASGQSVDIRKWLSEGDPNTGTTASRKLKNIYATDKDHVYKCTIYFMERGGFGSCCYMRYILPNYTEVPVIPSETTEVTVTKQWEDFNNPLRPQEITVKLLRNGKEVERTTFGGNGNIWTYTWKDLPVKDGSGNTYRYTVKEIVPAGYTAVQNGNTITNSLSPEVKVKVTKAWDDGGNECKDRPDSVTFRLLADGEPLTPSRTITLTNKNAVDSNTWSGTFSQLPKYRYYYDSAGLQRFTEINYTVQEMSGSGSGALALSVGSKLKGSHGTEALYQYELTEINQSAGLKEGETSDNYVAHAKFTNSHTHKLNVSKIWSDGNSAHSSEIVKIGLYEKSENSWEPVAGTVKDMVNESNGTIKAGYDGLNPGNEYIVRELITADSSDYDFQVSGAYYKGLIEGEIYGTNYQVSYTGPTEVNGHICEQSMTITNTLKNIETRLRVGKWIDNWNDKLDINDLLEDEFIVNVKRIDETGFETGVVLNHAGDTSGKLDESKISGYMSVITNGGSDIKLKIDEIIPKEYYPSNSFLTIESSNGQVTVNGDTVTMTPGAEAVILVHNTFAHDDYFHHDASAKNNFPAAGTNSQAAASRGVGMAAIVHKKTSGGRKSLEEDEQLM